ncbi:hypothetical protein QBC46DRAFT_452592 [Diplogelasinospora grovesii]|uniref:Uncharacterized protein n=1 Tax=Diplogelasinospora grovesii TaxID=303347 RepID=A0AAN6S0F4_9PEZI|nr:hypothetical protein QBC46DRAFT_452592 [Diplogelasinospora grovesii]
MAVRYSALGQTADDDTQDEDFSHFSASDLGSRLSPLSRRSTTTTTTANMASSSTFLNLSDQTFTPLSFDSSDLHLAGGAHCDESDSAVGNSLSPTVSALDQKSPLLPLMAIEIHSRTDDSGGGGIHGNDGIGLGSAGSSATTATPAASGAKIVSAMVQSFEALQATAARRGYDLVTAKNTGTRSPGLPSPPATLSPSPSTSPLARKTTETAAAPAKAPNASLEGTVRELGSSADGHAEEITRGSGAVRDKYDDNELHCQQQQPQNVQQTSTPGNVNALNSSPDFTPNSSPSDVKAQPAILRPTPRAILPVTTQQQLISTSSSVGIAIRHPVPDLDARSGACLGNIAALEATAERLSTTTSIEEAIREEHNELKRSDSRRSSILQANSVRKASGSDSGSISGQTQASIISRQNSILGTNNAARSGGYSPAGYVMSPHDSITAISTRLRSGSKASSIGAPSPAAMAMNTAATSTEVGNGEDFPFMSRHGPGKSSTRSAARLSLAEITESDLPMTLTVEALDAADRAAAAGEDNDDDDTIRASAHQFVESAFAGGLEDMTTAQAEVTQPMLDNAYVDQPAPRLQLHQPGDNPQYGQHNHNDNYHEDDRPATSGSGATSEQAEAAFGDFDGVHCDPEAGDFLAPQQPEFPPEPSRIPQPPRLPPPRPTSYFDPSTGQQMLYYPARVPAMLNLPPKLSKKPKAAVRNMRQSQVLSAMPQEAHESRIWLPDPLENMHGSQNSLPLMTGVMGDHLGSGPSQTNLNFAPQLPELDMVNQTPSLKSFHTRHPSETSTIHPSQPQLQEPELRRPPRLADTDKRKSRAPNLGDLPPQLRASAFFDLPSVTPKIEIKGGSAMATLDSILDASASAPVSAFTDHAFAGKLGSEVYGTEKKKKPKKATLTKRNPSTEMLNATAAEPRHRASFYSLGGDADEGRTTLGLVSGETGLRAGSMRDDASPRTEQGQFSPNPLAPGADEEADEDGESEEDEDEELYQGPPTTLLAELQLRKQRNKMRTRPIASAFPNGMHSTLLELDTVLEMERKQRKGKKINLAWEDPTRDPDHLEDLDDDDVPLGMLAIAKTAAVAKGVNKSQLDISAVMSEVHRPLGLMERRELEDNEPLSRRRERLQGRDSVQGPLSLTMMQKRMSQLTLTPNNGLGLLHNRSQSRVNLPLPQVGGFRTINEADHAEDENEGETLAARKARLAAEDPLPRARPVSGGFSSELLSQFGGDPEEGRPDSKGKGRATGNANGARDRGKENAPPGDVPEEEETLGQRRRRLQAEREAREREMASGGPIARAATPLSLIPNLGQARTTTLRPNSAVDLDANRLSRRLSMADVLNAHPLDSALGNMNPREQERLRFEAEAARVQRDKDFKMAALRAQMPTTLTATATGARNGGFMNGQFNDGLAGGAVSGGLGFGGAPQLQRMSSMGLIGQQGDYNANAYGMATPNSGGGYLTQMPINTNGTQMLNGSPGHIDMVERWRQSVLPS